MNLKGSRDQPLQQKVRKQELRVYIYPTKLNPRTIQNNTSSQSRDLNLAAFTRIYI